jgi:hypothetical protein
VSPSQYVQSIFSSTSAAEAGEIGSALGMAESYAFSKQRNSRFLGRAKYALGRNDKLLNYEQNLDSRTHFKTTSTRSCFRNSRSGSTNRSAS